MSEENNQEETKESLSVGSSVAENALGSGSPKRLGKAQTVCNERNEKGKLCNGFLKQTNAGGLQEAAKHLQGDDILFKCQTCRTLYVGPPLGHLRDADKQTRFVQNELTELLQAAGGTLPAIIKDERGVYILKDDSRRTENNKEEK